MAQAQKTMIGVLLAGALAFRALAAGPEAVGALDERALNLHEAWLEARLSMDEARLDREWARIVEFLKASLKGKARVAVTGNSKEWQIDLRPLSGPVMVRVGTSGSRLIPQAGGADGEPRTLESVYELRRHYDCEGRPLNAAKPGVPVLGKPCAIPPELEWKMVQEEISAGDGAVVQRVHGLACCYRVATESKSVLQPGQILVEAVGHPYRMDRLADDKLRLPYRDNRWLFIMDRKQPKVIVVKFSNTR